LSLLSPHLALNSPSAEIGQPEGATLLRVLQIFYGLIRRFHVKAEVSARVAHRLGLFRSLHYLCSPSSVENTCVPGIAFVQHLGWYLSRETAVTPQT